MLLLSYICCACAYACGRYSVTLSMRCFRLLSSMCQTSEIDGRCVHLRGSDRCEISYAATLTRSMCCRSTFEDPIDVNFIIMLLYSCMGITPRVCTLVLFIIDIITIINPRRACAARVTVLGLSFCLSVCLSVCLSATLFWQYAQLKV